MKNNYKELANILADGLVYLYRLYRGISKLYSSFISKLYSIVSIEKYQKQQNYWLGYLIIAYLLFHSVDSAERQIKSATSHEQLFLCACPC